MNLNFSTQIAGKPTYFVEKIHSGLVLNDIADFDEISFENQNFDVDKFATSDCKIHTIRKDEKNRWKAGVMIDFFINLRTPKAFRFAPRIPVVSTQEIDIYHHLGRVEIRVEEKLLNDNEIERLAINDGFENVEDFVAYFNEDFTGKLIHWTDIKY